MRGIERPTYGYYLDHLVDAIATAAIGIGLGLSPLMLLSIGTLIVVAYLMLSINVYLESFAFGRFSIGYGYIGPTEIRLILIALNTVVALGAGLDFVVADLELTVFDLIGLAIAGTMIVLLAGRAVRNLRELAAQGAGGPATLSHGIRQFLRRLRIVDSAPLAFAGAPLLDSPCGSGERKTAAKAKQPGLSKETRKALIRAKATREAGRASHP